MTMVKDRRPEIFAEALKTKNYHRGFTMTKPVSIKLHDPSGAARTIAVQKVATVYHCTHLAHPEAQSMIGYGKDTRSFREPVDQVVNMLVAHIPLMRLTLAGTDTRKPEDNRIWINKKRIVAVHPVKGGGSSVELVGAKGRVQVVNSPDEIESVIA